MRCATLWQENRQGEYHNRKSADERSDEMNCRGLDHCSPSIR